MIEFIVETREQFRSYLSKDFEGARYLREEVARLREDTGKLASIIDKKFRVVRERTEKEIQELGETEKEYPHVAPALDTSREVDTNIVHETRRLLHLLDQAERDEPGDKLRVVFDSDAEIKDRFWRITHKQSSSAHLISQRPSRDDYDLLSPLAEPGIKSCVSLSSAGYETGLDYFPVDATVAQARAFFQHYAKDLRRTADKLGNTHALLYFRLRMAEMVYHEHEQYRHVEKWTPGIVQKEWEDKDFSSSNLQNPQALLANIEKLLASPPDEGKDVWRKEEGSWVPNASGLYWHSKRYNQDLLRREPDARSSNPYITRQAFRDYVKYFTEARLVKLRAEAGLNPK